VSLRERLDALSLNVSHPLNLGGSDDIAIMLPEIHPELCIGILRIILKI
jgi:hypothetical protein